MSRRLRRPVGVGVLARDGGREPGEEPGQRDGAGLVRFRGAQDDPAADVGEGAADLPQALSRKLPVDVNHSCL
jgi:hypothetical protein